MKKIFLFVTFFVVCNYSYNQSIERSTPQDFNSFYGKNNLVQGQNSRAGGDIIIQDDFSNGFNNWTTSNLTSGTQGVWETGTNVPAEVDQYEGTLQTGTPSNGLAWFNGAQFLIAGNVDNQDAALTWSGPTINASTNNFVTLEFAHRYRPFNYDDIFVEVSNDGSNWTSYQVNPSQSSGTVDEIISFNISSVAANESNVRVRFRWVETFSGGDDNFGSGYGWQVDDFVVYESYQNDLKITDAIPFFGTTNYGANLEYFFIPEYFTTSNGIKMTGEYINEGAMSQTNVTLNGEVEFNGNNVFTGVSPVNSVVLTGEDDSTIINPSFFPTNGQGTYTFITYPDAAESEELPENDTLYYDIEITDSVYSRDNGVYGGNISNITSSPSGALKIGNIMEMPVSGSFGKVQIGVGLSSNPGQIIFAEIRKYNTSTSSFDFVAQSNDYVIQSSDIGNFVEFLVPDISYQPGDIFLVMGGHYGGNPSPAFSYAQNSPTSTVLGFSGGNIFALANPKVMMIRMDMSCANAVTGPANINITDALCSSSCDGEILVPNFGSNMEAFLFDQNKNLISSQGPTTSNINFSSLCDSTYYILTEIESVNGCTSRSDTTIAEVQSQNNVSNFSYTQTQADDNCGADNGSLNLVFFHNGTGVYDDVTIDWIGPSSGSNTNTNSGSFNEVINNLEAGNYDVTVTSDINAQCFETLTTTVEYQDQYQDVCVVSADSVSSNYNIIIWEKPSNAGLIDSFYIYREVTLNNYQKVGAVDYDDLSVFDDFSANPNSTSYKYKIAILDTCGTVYDLSDYHKSIHLQYFGGGLFQWSSYEIENQSNPVASYNFYRDDNGTGNWQILQVIPGGNTSFTDVDHTSYPNAQYYVDVNWQSGNSCTASKASTINASRSNITDNVFNPNDIHENELIQLTVYPNPFDDQLTLKISSEFSIEGQFYITDVTGKIVRKRETLKAEKNQYTIDMGNVSKGVYFVNVISNGKLYSKKIVK